MVFTEATFDKCLSKIEDINAILFFQNNFGLAIEMSKKISQQLLYDDNVIIDFQDNEKNFTTLLEEQLCDTFFSSKKIIKIYNFKPNGKSRLKYELDFLNKKTIKNKIVLFFGNELDGKSSIKTLFEKGDFTASIACYDDDEKTASKYIQDFFYKKNIKISTEAVKLMSEMLHGDRQLLSSECEKMMLYSDNNEITATDVFDAIVDEQYSTPINLSDAILSRNIQKSIKEFKFLEKSNIQMISTARIFTQAVEQILNIKEEIQAGKDINDAIKTKFIFWKRIPFIKKAVSEMTENMLKNYIKISIQVEKMAKIYGNDIAKQYFVRNIILHNLK